MAQPVRGFPCKHEDPSLILRIHIKNSSVVDCSNSRAVEAKTGRFLCFWPASLANEPQGRERV